MIKKNYTIKLISGSIQTLYLDLDPMFPQQKKYHKI